MTNCKICDLAFVNNLGGQLTNHIKAVHQLSFQEYIVRTKYNSISPVCQCGYCTEPPVFYRGKFLTYALDHNTFKKREEFYRAKHGDPKCGKCNNDVTFHRAIPNKYCSLSCAGLTVGGFNDPIIQQKIKDTVKARYGVDYISQLDSIKKKISDSKTGQPGHIPSEATRAKQSIASKKLWSEQHERMAAAITIGVNQPHVLAERSARMFKNREDPEFIEKMFASFRNRLSLLHKKIRSSLRLGELGFVSEQRIGRFFVDELHVEAKLIVEINGNYIHANPALYMATSLIRLPGNSYLASDKWAKDNQKLIALEALGFKVITIWETDNLILKREEILQALGSFYVDRSTSTLA